MTNFKLLINENTPYIDGWIKFVMSRNVVIMLLRLPDHNYIFPDFFYINSSVKQLTVVLFRCELKIPSVSVSWTSLKKLSLGFCNISSGYIDKILSGCPILESLKFDQCKMMRVLDLSKSLRLTTLEIDDCIWTHGPAQIVAPHTHYLTLICSHLLCTLADVSSLTEARLDTSSWLFVELNGAWALKMLEKLHNVEKLTFGAHVLKVLSLAELCGLPFPNLKVKDLRLETIVDQDTIHGLVRLLQKSPELKKLTVHGAIPEEYSDKLLGFPKVEIRCVISKGFLDYMIMDGFLEF